MIAAIVAVDVNWGIGFDGELLERIPEDMKRFRELTKNNVVVMGRKTWDSLPTQPLQDRSNIILSKSLPQGSCIYDSEAHYIQFISGIAENELKGFRKSSTSFFVIGGGQIYEQLLPYCDTVYLTYIGKDHKNVDTYFPRIDKDPEWDIDTCTELRESVTGIPYAFLTYKRV